MDEGALMPRPNSGPYRAFNDTFAPIDYTAQKGYPSSSWWADHQGTREEFIQHAHQEAPRMAGSQGSKWIDGLNYNEKLTAVFGSRAK